MAKKALLVGINQYSNTAFNLHGCENDVASCKALLTSSAFGFSPSDISILTSAAATNANIKNALSTLVSGATVGDVLVFLYSGHGTQKAAINDASEIDGMDEAIVPFESSYASLITDNELNSIITKGLGTSGANFTAIYDCCHAGSLIKDISFDSSGNVYIDIINRNVYVPFLADEDIRSVSIGPYNTLSACSDAQTAADLRDVGGGVARGAFTYALFNQLNENPDIVISDLDAPVLAKIKTLSRHLQEPQYFAVDSSKKLFGR